MHTVYEWLNSSYLISTDKKKSDQKTIHQSLTRSTWAAGIDMNPVAVSIENSLTFGVYDDASQIGFARLITDYVV